MKDILAFLMYAAIFLLIVSAQIFIATWSLTQILGYQVHWFPVLILMFVFGAWKE